MEFYTIFFLFLSLSLGLIIGSFLNVVLFRYQTGRGLSGRSGCMTCGKQLAWLELIPVISFFLQKAACRNCRAKLSWQYPVVETMTGVTFLLLAVRFLPGVDAISVWSLLTLAVYWIIGSFLILISVYDFNHKVIPDEWVIGMGLCGIILPIVSGGSFGYVFFSLLNKCLSALILAGFLWSIWYFSKGRAMGYGDVKLAVSVGLVLGLMEGITAMVLAFWVGAIVGIFLVVASKYKKLPYSRKLVNLKSEIPFAPFIVLGVFISLILNFNVLPF